MAEVTNGVKILVNNRKAYYNYILSDFLECGIELQGSEIKSIRNGGCNISDAYVLIKNGECYILNMNVSEYKQASVFNHEPLRTRKLLLHKEEILKFENKVKEKGFTIVPTKIYLKKGYCKVEIALGKGKNVYDKRQAIKQREINRQLRRVVRK